MTHLKKMTKIASKINLLKIQLMELSAEIKATNTSGLSSTETDKYLCDETAVMMNDAFKHILSNHK